MFAHSISRNGPSLALPRVAPCRRLPDDASTPPTRRVGDSTVQTQQGRPRIRARARHSSAHAARILLFSSCRADSANAAGVDLDAHALARTHGNLLDVGSLGPGG